jgi:23S rRNA (uracil1939-C5)-methyltransferase
MRATIEDELDLQVERPIAGGRMLARAAGQIVFVSGTVPGERVRARVERRTRDVLWARTIDVLEAGPSRRETTLDAACGGLAYAHIHYDDQRRFKAEILADAFRRIARRPLAAPPEVAPSPETGYRLRARLHLHGGRAGFLREGTHDWCDADGTGQLARGSVAAIAAALEQIGESALRSCKAVLLAENIAANERVLHLEPFDGQAIEIDGDTALSPGITGLTTSRGDEIVILAGAGRVADAARDLFGDPLPAGVDAGVTWSRGAVSFFQGNRYVTGTLARHVLAQISGTRVVDAYAGVGLFALPLASRGCDVIAIEADAHAAADLDRNSARWIDRLRVVPKPVERALPRVAAGSIETIVLDPPRTGLSPAALDSLARLSAPQCVYVSCDPATLARDAGRLFAHGYELDDVRAFDLFPNTAHIEAVATFSRR